jgi:hypothetical protein
MLTHTRCDQCRAVLEVSDKKIGKAIVCSQCDCQFVAVPLVVAEEALELAEDEPDVQRPHVSEAVLNGSPVKKHALTLPLPPTEEWNESEDEEDDNLPGQRFARFRPNRKRMKEFIDPDGAGDDHAWLLVAGLGAFAFVLLVFMIGLIVVIFR